MTLMELQVVLGEQIEAVANGTADVEQARAVASLAKQMINNADIVLRGDKFSRANGKRTDYIIGEIKDNSGEN